MALRGEQGSTPDLAANHRVAAESTPASTVDLAVNVRGRSFGADIVAANDAGPQHGTLDVFAASMAPNSTAVSKQTKPWFIPPRVQQLDYDHDGNLTSDGVWDYTYDAENRLVRMKSKLSAGFPQRHLLEFTYDYQGRRVQKKVWSLTTGNPPEADTLLSTRRFLYDGDDLVADFNYNATTAALTLVRSYAWGLDMASSLGATGGIGALVRIADHATGKRYFPTYDGNGNVAALLDAHNGEVAVTYEYGPFGEPLRRQVREGYASIADQPFGFSTKFTDHETGLVFYGARYYSSSLGRFLNRDPMGEAGGLNLNGFAGNDAVNRWDFRGYWWGCWGWGDDYHFGGGGWIIFSGGGGGGGGGGVIANAPTAVRSAGSLGQHGMSPQEHLAREVGLINDPPPGSIYIGDGRYIDPADDISDLVEVVVLAKVTVPEQRGPTTYDKISAGIHGLLGILGGIPVLGIIPDAVDLIYVIVELPLAKPKGS
ncbi:MAG: RHS repeat-associated core domain-containing protein [Opitutaceae bacterium]|nr:RHS repeat-associated core domain-containing protein [Opitutaceae bacterium]